MKDFDKEIDLCGASSIVERTQEWRKWIEEIPYISFTAEWEVKIISVPHIGGYILTIKMYSVARWTT